MKAKDLKVGDRWYHPPNRLDVYRCIKLQNTLKPWQKGPKSVELNTGMAYWTPPGSEVELVQSVKTAIRIILTGK